MTAANSGQIKTAPQQLQLVLERIARLLETQPDAALAQAVVVLKQAPNLPPAELLACQALRRLGKPAEALQRLAILSDRHPRVPAVLWEVGAGGK